MNSDTVFVCFFDESVSGECDREAMALIESLDNRGFEVHYFGILRSELFSLDSVLASIQSLNKRDGTTFVFMSDIPGLFKLVYRLYQRAFSLFAYIVGSVGETARRTRRVGYLSLDSVCSVLQNEKIRPEEGTYKTVFCDKPANCDFDDLALSGRVSKFSDIFEPLRPESAEDPTNIYKIQDRFYVFYPSGGSNVIIDLDVAVDADSKRYKQCKVDQDEVGRIKPSVGAATFAFNFDREVLGLLMEFSNRLKISPHDYLLDNASIAGFVNMIMAVIGKSRKFEQDAIFLYLELIADSYSHDLVYKRIFLYSVLIVAADNANRKTRYLNAVLSSALNSDLLTASERYYVYYQCVRIDFVDAAAGGAQTRDLLADLYRKSFQGFRSELRRELEFIPKEDRNKDTALVLIGQFLGIQHGPTKTALDRCRALIDCLGVKNASIINTCEVLTSCGAVPFYNDFAASKDIRSAPAGIMLYGECSIPYIRIEKSMPSVDGLREIIELVKRLKPYYILGIGGSLISLDICSSLVPTVCISTVPSDMAITESTFQVIGRKVNDGDMKRMARLGLDREHVIESVFTSSFRRQTTTLNRETLKLPENKFLLLVVGGRLDFEVTSEFLAALKKTFDRGTHIVFAGGYNNYETVVNADPELRRNSTYIGFASDMLAVCEVCDLYANPKRVGGGTSVAEAMFKGLPAVTLRYGDVYIGTGEEFGVDDYDEMTAVIMRYAQDREFYDAMSKKAIERARVLTDTDAQFEKIINTAINSKLFR